MAAGQKGFFLFTEGQYRDKDKRTGLKQKCLMIIEEVRSFSKNKLED